MCVTLIIIIANIIFIIVVYSLLSFVQYLEAWRMILDSQLKFPTNAIAYGEGGRAHRAKEWGQSSSLSEIQLMHVLLFLYTLISASESYCN